MVLAKSKNAIGLGNSLMNDRFGHGKGTDRKKVTPGIHRTAPDGTSYVTNGPKEASWVKMRSVTEQGALDDFLSTAELAGTDFTAEKMNNVKIIHTDQKNPYLLSAAEERSAVRKQTANRSRLTVPRRPQWDDTTTPDELDRKERVSLLEWRRGLAELQETNDLLMTPFERNLEVWRQLWRVIERSDLVVQIVDARHPLLFRSDDLEKYVKEVSPRKNNLLLVNKADMMTLNQRLAWAKYFESKGIAYKFFSAAMSKETNELRDLEDQATAPKNDDEGEVEVEVEAENGATREEVLAEKIDDLHLKTETSTGPNHDSAEDSEDQRSRILSVDELEALFLEHAPEIEDEETGKRRKTQIGLVGYPNVGKSSTINALIGAKKVSVSSTPGKTKHFQTIHLSELVILCDCPGLVFPNFTTTKAELVCNGILPIDQLREFTGPAGLVARRVPQSFLEALYGIKIQIRPFEEGGTGVPTAEELLIAYATARGFTKTGQGQPDESRAARYILKDYVNGKLLFCHPPPTEPTIDPLEFNAELYDDEHLPQRRRGALAHDDTVSATGQDGESLSVADLALHQPGAKSTQLDKRFFAADRGSRGHLTRPFQYKYSEQGSASGKQLSGRKQRTMTALDKNMDPRDLAAMQGKKHFKGGKRGAPVTSDLVD